MPGPTTDGEDGGAGASGRTGLAATIAKCIGVEIRAVTSLAGGDVAESFRVDLVDGTTVFAKTHHRPPPGFFTTEARGLAWLRSAATVPVPQVIVASDEPPLLILEWIEESPIARPDEPAFGRA
ncbi:MAG: fructosamine kinase family protein, partial [Acidimicrobiales bacterium]